jgi:hypothetical protein
MGSDLAALTPPFLVCVAFLIAVGAFLRHEMRRAKNRNDEDDDEVSVGSSARQVTENPPGPGAKAGLPEEGADRPDTGPTS